MTKLATTTLLFVALFLTTACQTTHPTNNPTQTPATSTHQIEEDEPGWDCHTMGNHICGPTELQDSQ